MIRPPERLVIYEAAGTWDPPDRLDLGDDFLGFWVEGDYTFFFYSADRHDFQSFLSDRGLTLRHVHRMGYDQWQDGADFRSFSVGPLTIASAWDPQSPGDENAIRVDPGLAFGFGGHPTTRVCLAFLVRAFQMDPPKTILDLGAGTGILSLAAVRLGADRAVAVEYSHAAADTARRNAVLNGLTDRIEVIRGRAEDHGRRPAELAASNLHASVQRRLLELGAFDGRRLVILSGLFDPDAQDIKSELLKRGLKLIDLKRDERWTTMMFEGR